MPLLYRIFGWPHELLHVVALWLVGRRAVSITGTHVDIPADLSTRQYVFVAGFPALVFWTVEAVSIMMLFRAQMFAQLVLWLAITLAAGMAAMGTVGDLILILARLQASQEIPPEE